MSSTALASESGRLHAPPPLELGHSALFADLDGTLAPIEARPEDVGPDARRAHLLDRLSAALGGRLAIISGRGLADLDRVLSGRVRAVSAVHGLVRRRSDGQVVATAARLPRAALEAVTAFAASHPEVIVEDKGPAIALHYRASPSARAPCEDVVRRLAETLDLEVQFGRMVAELRARGPTKADAVAAFLAEPPFQGATPVFLGDDLTDEDGFSAAQSLGGHGIIVGARRPTQARYALADVDAALAWIEAALEHAP